MNTEIENMKYNDLKKLAAARGLNASGTAEELKARLLEADGDDNQPPAPPQDAPEQPKQPSEESDAPLVTMTPQKERGSQQKADRQLKKDAQKMKEHLAKQRKVSIMIPFDQGVNAEDAKHIPFHVNLNGYPMDLPRGQYIEVPEQVAEVIRERLESEGKIGQQWRIDRDEKKAQALI